MKIVTTVTAVTTYTIPRLAVTGVLAQERVHPRLAAGVVIADGVSQHLFIMFLQLADTIAICRVKLKSAAKSIFYQRVHNRSTGCISIEIVFLTIFSLT